ncbi:uncharacterized protein [Hetaerina americana]|uniref:uncharacterized protein n=1 Tax=Hetaerina americana TaxID=62018 RepID=UPI003A7F216B
MKAFLALLALVGVASAGFIPATTLVRTPSLDSAVIKSERLGGNFAYSSVEGHSYAAVSPVVQHVATPVAVSYQAHAPVVTGVTAHAALPVLRSGLYSNLIHPYAYSPIHHHGLTVV